MNRQTLYSKTLGLWKPNPYVHELGASTLLLEMCCLLTLLRDMCSFTHLRILMCFPILLCETCDPDVFGYSGKTPLNFIFLRRYIARSYSHVRKERNGGVQMRVVLDVVLGHAS